MSLAIGIPHRNRVTRGERSASGASRNGVTQVRESRHSTRSSRFRGPVQQSPARRQETQIVQSRLTLRDFLP